MRRVAVRNPGFNSGTGLELPSFERGCRRVPDRNRGRGSIPVGFPVPGNLKPDGPGVHTGRGRAAHGGSVPDSGKSGTGAGECPRFSANRGWDSPVPSLPSGSRLEARVLGVPSDSVTPRFKSRVPHCGTLFRTLTQGSPRLGVSSGSASATWVHDVKTSKRTTRRIERQLQCSGRFSVRGSMHWQLQLGVQTGLIRVGW